MARRWRNYTDLPDETLRAIYAAVLPAGLPAHDVEIKNNASGGGRGVAYSDGSSYHATARPFVVVSIPTTDAAARCRRDWNLSKGGYLPVAHGNRLECFVYIIAHELMRLILAILIALIIVTYTPPVAQCGSDSNCAAVWDDTSGLPYTLDGAR